MPSTASALDENRRLQQDDIFEKDNLVSSGQGAVQDVSELDSPQEIPEDFDELPIELISLIDRYGVSWGYFKTTLIDYSLDSSSP